MGKKNQRSKRKSGGEGPKPKKERRELSRRPKVVIEKQNTVPNGKRKKLHGKAAGGERKKIPGKKIFPENLQKKS